MARRLGISLVAVGALALTAVGGCTGTINGPPGSNVTSTGSGAAGGSTTGSSGLNPGGSGSSPVTGSGGPSMPGQCSSAASFAPARLWKITDEQYIKVVAQVFGVRMPPGITAKDSAPAEYTNYSEAPEGDTTGAYHTAAQTAAQAAVSSNLNVFLPCGGATPSDACVESFIRHRVARAFGRPLADTEVQDLLGIYHTGLMTETAAAGIRLVIEATLQSPSFLYRTELGAPTAGAPTAKVTLTAHELAQAVSFALLDSVPDDALWQKAEDGSLLTPSVMAAEVDRLLALPAVQTNLSDKASFWLGIEKLRSIVPKDRTLFPEFTAQVTQDLYASAKLFVQDLFAHGTVSDLLTSSRLYLNTNLATVYGVPGVTSTSLTGVNDQSGQRSAGILTQPAVLAAWSHPDSGDAVHRGLFIYNALVCGPTIPAPPANALAVAMTFPPNATEREKAHLRATAPQGCGACHGRFDPLGLTTERYDPIGRYKATDATGAPIDSSAIIASLGPDLDGPVSGLPDLVAKLKGGTRVTTCAVRNMYAFTLGRSALDDNSCALPSAASRFAASGSFPDFFRAVFTSPAFLTRDVGP
jgi:Protein of unknown function (DUF1592)/Protein of unknown function (DUF1588)/Protein of unknown function (DUF1595)/Protein of unknown function (DUF1585)